MKAFDRVNHQFLDTTLEFFGFGEIFRAMVRNVHKDAVSCTVNMGFSSDYINIEQGLRQGSSLSPGLFNLVVETLGMATRQNPNIQGIKIGKSEKNMLSTQTTYGHQYMYHSNHSQTYYADLISKMKKTLDPWWA